jgi:hypothetical protein
LQSSNDQHGTRGGRGPELAATAAPVWQRAGARFSCVARLLWPGPPVPCRRRLGPCPGPLEGEGRTPPRAVAGLASRRRSATSRRGGAPLPPHAASSRPLVLRPSGPRGWGHRTCASSLVGRSSAVVFLHAPCTGDQPEVVGKPRGLGASAGWRRSLRSPARQWKAAQRYKSCRGPRHCC